MSRGSTLPRARHTVTAAFIAGSILAGGNAVGIRFSNRELAPLWGAGLRFASAGLLLLGVMAVRRMSLPRGRALAGAVAWGALQFTAAFGFAYHALVHLHAGIGQVLLALTPLVTLLVAVAERQERFRVAAVAGTASSLAGVAVISRGAPGGAVPVGSVLLVVASVLCVAQAGVLVHRLPPLSPVVQNGIGMFVGGCGLLLASVIAREPRVVPERAQTWGALAYLVLVGSVVVFLLYVYVLQHWDASRAAYAFVIIPFVTVLLSAWLDDEPLGPGLILGGLLVIAGVYVGALRRADQAPAGPA